MRILKNITVLLLFVISFNSCRKEVINPYWDVDLLAPVLNARLTIHDLLNDTLIRTGNDSLVSLVYQNQLYRFSLDSFLNMPDTNYRYSAYLDSIKLYDVIIEQNYTLGEIIMGAGLGFLLPDGSTHEIGPITGISSNDIIIDATQYFQTMTLSTGFLDISITNNLPVDMTNVIFQLKNANDNLIVLQDTFPLISVGTTISETVSLAGKTVNGTLIGKIINMDTPGSYGVPIPIDYGDKIVTKLKIYNLEPYSATAIFPAQNLMNTADKIEFWIKEIQLSEIIIRTGYLELDAYNTIEDPIHFTYCVRSCIKNGDTLRVTGTIDAAVNGEAAVLHQIINLTGYTLNLRGAGPVEQFFNTDMNLNGHIDNDTINTIFVTAIGRIDSTGHVISLSLQDSFIFLSRLKSLVPEYAIGYLGRDTFSSASMIGFDVFEGLQDGTISLEDTKISLSVRNQVGASARVRFNNISATDTETGAESTLIFPPGSNPLIITKPQDPYSLTTPVTPAISTLYLDNTNSNAQELISLMPDKLSYNIDLFMNPGIPPPPLAMGDDFVYYDGILTASLDIEVPLCMAATNLTLVDTTDFSLDEQSVENINNGHLDMWVKNWFPLEAHIQLYTLDNNLNITDSLFSIAQSISHGIIPAGNDRVIEPETSLLKIYLNNKRLKELTESKKIKIIARFDSYPTGEHIKIFSDYSIEFRISGDINYHVN